MSLTAPIMVEDTCLDCWIKIGAGGFGQIYKARHKKLCCDVAIKLLHFDDGSGSSLLRELEMMRQGSSPYVIHVLGVFRGLSPSGPAVRLGLVMEFMERGCLATLQERLCGVPPWPLIFRLAHQIALGINFLHNLRPPLLHLDLKPNNILLDSSLNAKLTDFGLAKVYRTMSRVSKKESSTEEGTLSYMPPEAFDLSYTPTKASDIYSYGILLWSLITGKQPYPHALSCIVRLRIPQGDRPSVEEIRVQAAGIAGLSALQDLMERCWAMRPSERPSSYNCTLETEELFKLHKHTINCAVLRVQQKLDQTPSEDLADRLDTVHLTETVNPGNGCFNVPTGKGPVQENAGFSLTKEQNSHKDQSVPFPVPVSDTELDPSLSPRLKPSSVKPIEATRSPSSSSSPSTNSTKKSPQTAFLKKSQPYQRQFSSPDTCQQPSVPHINIYGSEITGLQIGNQNFMHIQGLPQFDRRRHPSAPSRVDLQRQRKSSGKDKKGGDG